VSDGEASIGARDDRCAAGQPPLSEAIDLVPCGLVLVAALTKNAAPEIDDMVAEGGQSRPVVGHAMVREISKHDTGQPLALFGSGCMHPPSKLRLDGLRLGPHPVAARTPPDLETPLRVRPQMWVKPRKSKVCGLPSPPALRLAAAKRPTSISRVLSGWSARAYSAMRVSRSTTNRTASVRGSNPMTVSSGISHDDHLARGWRCRHSLTHRSRT
jgi:hypothetical protein